MIYFDNAYRILGLFDNATRGEARAVFHQLKIRSKLAGGTGPADPLGALAPVNRGEDALRDAFNGLGNVTERLRQRLCWFSNRTSRDGYALDCMASGDFKGAVEAWASGSDPDSRANLARLYHAMVIARDVLPAPQADAPGAAAPEIPASYAWIDAARAWRDVLGNEKFWDEFAGIERAAGFEPLAFAADFASLRANAWEILLEPSFILLTKLTAAGEYGMARDHLEDLRDAGLPAPNITDLEKDGFVMVASGVDATIDEIATEMNNSTQGGIAPVRAAYERFRSEVLPTIREMLRLAGFNFEPSRQLCETGAEFLQNLAERASAAGSGQYALAIQSEGQSLLKGIIEMETRPPASNAAGSSRSTSSNYRPTGTASTTKSNVPIWVIVKLILLVIGGFARYGGCEGSGSRYSGSLYSSTTSTYPDYSAPEASSSPDAPVTIEKEEDDALTTRTGDPVELQQLQALGQQIMRDESTLGALVHRMDDANSKVAYLDSEAAATAPSDTVMRGVARRAVAPWLTIYNDRWTEFDTLYRSCQANIASFNRDLRKLPKTLDAGRRPEKIEIQDDVSAGYADHKRKIAKWNREYGKAKG